MSAVVAAEVTMAAAPVWPSPCCEEDSATTDSVLDPNDKENALRCDHDETLADAYSTHPRRSTEVSVPLRDRLLDYHPSEGLLAYSHSLYPGAYSEAVPHTTVTIPQEEATAMLCDLEQCDKLHRDPAQHNACAVGRSAQRSLPEVVFSPLCDALPSLSSTARWRLHGAIDETRVTCTGYHDCRRGAPLDLQALRYG
jgi:hypothetical protein